MSIDLAEKAAAGHVDRDILDWLRNSFEQYLAGNADLAKALKLDRESRLRQRNTALLEAAAMLDDGKGPWHTAGQLAAALARYQRRIAPILRRDPGYEIGELDAALRRALAAAPCPTTHRKIYAFLK